MLDPTLQTFFNPKKIALIGASERGIYPAGIMHNLLDHGWKERVNPINPNRQSVFGVPCFPSVLDLPESPDLAIVTVPRNAVLPVLQDCIQTGVQAVVVITAGFAETDQEGRRLQKELQELVKDHPIRLIGPNCAGLASFPENMIATRLFADFYQGPVSFVSQSGALMMSLQGVFADRQIGLSRIVSLGNQADVSLAEMLNFLVEDPKTEVITIFMEGIREAGDLVRAFKKALEVGKPIILLKTGRTQRGMAAAATHTAALSGEDRVFKAVCDQFGVILVDDIEPMMDITQIAAAFGQGFSRLTNVGVISQSGGMGSLTADWIERTQIEAPQISKEIKTKLMELGTIPDYVELLNPADVRGMSVRGEVAGKTLAVFLGDPVFDGVIMLFARPLITEESADTARAIVSAAKKFTKPVMIVWSGQRYGSQEFPFITAREIFLRAGIPLFSQASSLLKAIQRLQNYWRYREIWLSEFSKGDNDV